MADRMFDDEDRFLETVFRSEAIADDGFSKQIVARIRHRLWINRLAMPVAVVVGFAIAGKPMLQLLDMLVRFLGLLPGGISTAVISALPQIQVVILGGMLLVVALGIMRALEE